MHKTIIKSVFASAVLIHSAGVSAQQGYGFSKKVGEADFYPAVRVEYLTDSNVLLNAENETEASGVRVTPEFLYRAGKGLVSLEAEYKGEYNSSDVSVASYADHALRFEGNAEFSSRIRAGARLGIVSDHQELGTYLTRGIADENTDAVEYNQTTFDVFSRYGAAQAKGNIELGLSIDSLNFSNQSDLTDGESYNNVEPYAQFSLRVSPDLRALAEVRFGSTSYDNSGKDRSDTTFLLGVDIAPTGKLNGQIKVGSTLTSYDANDLSDSSELVMRSELKYAPVDYSLFSLVVDREVEKLSDNAATINAAEVTDLVQLNWTHYWSTRFFHRAKIARTSIQRDCPSQDVIVNLVGYEFNLQFRRWLEFGVGGTGASREATSCGDPNATNLSYDRTLVGIHVRATL